jgi:hypothetical protein
MISLLIDRENSKGPFFLFLFIFMEKLRTLKLKNTENPKT